MKVLWIANMPSLYRVKFMNELGKLCDLTVMFERYSATGFPITWKDELARNFKAIFHKTIPIGREEAIGFDLLKIDYMQYDKIIFASYCSPAEILAQMKLIARKIPYCIEIDGGYVNRKKNLKNLIKKFLISHASLCFSTGKAATDYLKYYGGKHIVKYPFTSVEKSDVLANPLSEKEKSTLKIKLNIKEKKAILGVGQFIHRKGWDILLNSLDGIPNDVGIYIMSGEPTEEYLEIVKRKNLSNVHFIKLNNNDDLYSYYKASDLFVLPTREDIWGLVINEAMANGLPIITTDKCVSASELVIDGINGYIVTSENIESLNEKICQLISDEKTLNEMG